jgi:Protein of unknown function (DUF3455)
VAKTFFTHAGNTRPSSATSLFGMQKLRRRNIMYYTKFKVQLLALIALLIISVPAMALDNSNGPELPEQCSSLAVDEGHKLAFHVYARGVQIYKWNGTGWDFDAPRASLFVEENFFGEVGTHFRGPHWESKSGSRVKAAAVPGKACTPDASAIAWLQLKSTEISGAGIFKNVTYIQRVNTTGGLRPTTFGSFLGEIKEVEYTAEYYFYTAENLNGN